MKKNNKKLRKETRVKKKIEWRCEETTHQEKTIITQKKKNGASQKCLENIDVKKERKKSV